MLIDFKFKNFGCFSNETNLSMEADSAEEFSNTLIKWNDLKLLPVAAIFGSNGSGKTTILDALHFMKEKITNKEEKNGQLVLSYQLDKDSFFSIKFIIDNKLFHYQFTLKNYEVKSELLEILEDDQHQETIIFSRDEKEVILHKSLEEVSNINISMYEDELLLSYLKNLKTLSLNKIYTWFENLDFCNTLNILDTKETTVYLKKNLDNDQAKKALVKFLTSIDPTITDIYYREDFGIEGVHGGYITTSGDHLFFDPGVYITHEVNDKTFHLPLIKESNGIRIIVYLFFKVYHSLKTGSPLIINDFGVFLHPLITREFITNFINKEANPKHTQLIFTSNNFEVLAMDLLSSDEVWFTKKQGVSSKLLRLTNFEDNYKSIKLDKDFLNNYFQGQYGSIPELKEEIILDESE